MTTPQQPADDELEQILDMVEYFESVENRRDVKAALQARTDRIVSEIKQAKRPVLGINLDEPSLTVERHRNHTHNAALDQAIKIIRSQSV